MQGTDGYGATLNAAHTEGRIILCWWL